MFIRGKQIKHFQRTSLKIMEKLNYILVGVILYPSRYCVYLQECIIIVADYDQHLLKRNILFRLSSITYRWSKYKCSIDGIIISNQLLPFDLVVVQLCRPFVGLNTSGHIYDIGKVTIRGITQKILMVWIEDMCLLMPQCFVPVGNANFKSSHVWSFQSMLNAQ